MPHIESLDDANLEGSVTVGSPMLAKRQELDVFACSQQAFTRPTSFGARLAS
jgi:hypothetical protein